MLDQTLANVGAAAAATTLLSGMLVPRLAATAQLKMLYKPAQLAPGHEDHIEVMRAGDNPLQGWIDNPGCRSAVVYFGGSSEQVELRRSALSTAFPDHTRILVPYRGFGPNRHLLPDEKTLKQDAEALCRQVVEAYDTVNIIGRSLGTSIAAHCAARIDVNALALITPFDSVLSAARRMFWYIPVNLLLSDRHEVWRDASGISSPVLACLAEVDKVTPHDLWEKLQAHFSGSPDVFTCSGTDHNSIALDGVLWSTIADFFAAPRRA